MIRLNERFSAVRALASILIMLFASIACSGVSKRGDFDRDISKKFVFDELAYYEKNEPEHRYIFRANLRALAALPHYHELIEKSLLSLENNGNNGIIFTLMEPDLSLIAVGEIDVHGVGNASIIANDDSYPAEVSIPFASQKLGSNSNPCFEFVGENTTDGRMSKMSHARVLFLTKVSQGQTISRSAVYGPEFADLLKELSVQSGPSFVSGLACYQYIGITK